MGIEWIKVSDRMPPEKVPVLIYVKRGVVNSPVKCVAQWRKDRDSWDTVGATGWEWENDFNDSDITHWMPLPADPTDEVLPTN